MAEHGIYVGSKPKAKSATNVLIDLSSIYVSEESESDVPLDGKTIRSATELTEANRTAVLALEGVASATLTDRYTITFTIGTEFDEPQVLKRVRVWMTTNGIH